MNIASRQCIHNRSEDKDTTADESEIEGSSTQQNVGSQNEITDSFQLENFNQSQSSSSSKQLRKRFVETDKYIPKGRNSSMVPSDEEGRTLEYIKNKPRNPHNFPESAPRGWCCFETKIVLLMIVLVAFSAFYALFRTVECPYTDLESNYPQENFEFLWKPLRSTVEDILNSKSNRPAVFLFVHNDTDKPKNLIKDIAKTSSQCFDSKAVVQNIDFTSREAIQDYGNVIVKYKKTIKEKNVILIANLNEIPAEAAKALHAICDTVTPMVNKVVIYLSLSVKPKRHNEKVIDTAQNALKNLWKDGMSLNELDPVITRVTDQVLLLQSN